MAKTATERLGEEKQTKVVLDKDFAGIKAGQKMFVATPQIVDAYIRSVPRGETRSMPELRAELARQNKRDATCPVSIPVPTAIFARIAAQAAIEAMDKGDRDISPFWRVVGLDDKVAAKLNVDKAWLSHQREMESA